MNPSFRAALGGLFLCVPFATALPTPSVVNEISFFSVARSPSGIFFDEDASNLLYVLCGTQTNGDHYLYVYTTDGMEKCLITIPESSGMSRVDGFYITHDDAQAYIVDSQGPIWADDEGRLGGSVYKVDWTDPCGCNGGTCTSTDVEWSPTVTKQFSLMASDVSATEGGGVDEHFRNSGIVVVDGYFFGVNGVHPAGGSLSGSYPKSIVKVDSSSGETEESWAFDGSTVGRDVDMEGLTCGPDQCASSLFIGDEYNFVYELDLETGTVAREWDIGDIANVFVTDKGIEALTYASTTGYFYAGIQNTAEIHVLELLNVVAEVSTDPEALLDDEQVDCANSTDYPTCTAVPIPGSQKRTRREMRSLSTDEWNNAVAALWTMKTTSMDSGKELYGESFRNYDYFVLKHAVAVTDTRGDQGHAAAHFMVWHMAFMLEFENALLSVDPSIGALPYWDECLTEPSIFTEEYFGRDPEGEPFEVTTGRFAYWPILSNFSWDDWSAYIADETYVGYSGSGDPNSAFLRGSENLVNSTYMNRYGSGTAWEASVGETCTDYFWDCTSSTENWLDWFACIEGGSVNYPSAPALHSPHPVIGGRVGGGGGRPGGGPPGGGGPPPGGRSLQGGGGGGRGPSVRGDLEDPQTSPNSPLFMFFHANLDRNRLWWMQRHSTDEDKCNYYGFPVENAPRISGPDRFTPGGADYYGAHLNDISSSAWGFTLQDLGFEGFATVANTTNTINGTVYQVTNADLLCWLDPSTAPYTYDSHLDCLVDSSFCHVQQELEPEVVYVDAERPRCPDMPEDNLEMEGEPDVDEPEVQDFTPEVNATGAVEVTVERSGTSEEDSESALLDTSGASRSIAGLLLPAFMGFPLFYI